MMSPEMLKSASEMMSQNPDLINQMGSMGGLGQMGTSSQQNNTAQPQQKQAKNVTEEKKASSSETKIESHNSDQF